MSTAKPHTLASLAKNFDWAGLPPNSTVVDVGGSMGHVSVYLARQFPHLQFIVQDRDEVVVGAEATLPLEVRDRVRFMAHDMFLQQPVQDADVYLFRHVFHDWSDKYCVRILKALIPALKKGAKIVVQECIVAPPGTMNLVQERFIRYVRNSLSGTYSPSIVAHCMETCMLRLNSVLTRVLSDSRTMDIRMLVANNAREREEDDWRQLFAKTDDRFGPLTARTTADYTSAGTLFAEWTE